MLQLHGRTNSSNVQSVIIALTELGLPFQQHDVGGLFGGNRTEDYLRRNPNGLVPMLSDGELDVWESHAILRYLAHRYGPTPLYPADPAARSHVERWLDWRQTTFGPPVGYTFFAYIRTRRDERNETLLYENERKSNAGALLLDAHLSGKTWVTGDTFTLADIGLAMFAHRYDVLPYATERPDLPHLKAWLARLRGRPSIAQFTSVELT